MPVTFAMLSVKSDVKSDKSDGKSKGFANSSSDSKTPAKSSKRGKYAKKSVHMVDDEFSDLSTEGSVSVVTDVSTVLNDKARPLFCKMKIDNNVNCSTPNRSWRNSLYPPCNACW